MMETAPLNPAPIHNLERGLSSPNAHPFKTDNLLFCVDYNDSTLNIDWNFRAIPADSGFSCRHILVVDLSNQLFASNSIMKYYKMLPLGDFLKVVDANMLATMPWI